jgi:hypothetical protein
VYFKVKKGEINKPELAFQFRLAKGGKNGLFTIYRPSSVLATLSPTMSSTDKHTCACNCHTNSYVCHVQPCCDKGTMAASNVKFTRREVDLLTKQHSAMTSPCCVLAWQERTAGGSCLQAALAKAAGAGPRGTRSRYRRLHRKPPPLLGQPVPQCHTHLHWLKAKLLCALCDKRQGTPKRSYKDKLMNKGSLFYNKITWASLNADNCPWGWAERRVSTQGGQGARAGHWMLLGGLSCGLAHWHDSDLVWHMAYK